MKSYRLFIGILAGIAIAVGAIFISNRSLSDKEQASPAGAVVPSQEGGIPTQPAAETQVAEEQTGETPAGSIPPTPRAELESTDPSTVRLDSGEIQLIELFAYW